MDPLTSPDQLFGRIAQMKGLINEAQLSRALRFQEEIRSLGLSRTLGEILRDDGVLDAEQVELVLRLQAINQKAQYERRFGRIAVKNELLTKTQLQSAMATATQEGFQRSLGTILEEQGMLDPRMVRAIHSAMERALTKAPIAPESRTSTGRLAQVIDVEGEEAEVPDLEERIADVTFAAVALRDGLVLVPELERAVREQLVRPEKPRLEDVLRERGILSTEEAEQIQAALAEARNEHLSIPGYDVTDVLGYGITSIVLAAKHAMIDRAVAIKLFRAEHVAATTADALVEEARAIAKIRHPNVVGLYEVGRVHRRIFFVMELVDGPTLTERVRRGGPLSEKDALQMIRDTAHGLTAIHEPGFVHRDVKPQNVLFTSDGQAKLTDLGLACEAGALEQEIGGAIYGSPQYMSPEQANGEAVDVRADLYGLGATTYFALTGQPPYAGNDMITILMGHMTAPVPDPRSVRADLSDPMAELVMRLMGKTPAERPDDAAEVLRQVEGILAFS